MRPDARFICDGEHDQCLDPREGWAGGYCGTCHEAPASSWSKVFAVVAFGLLVGWIIVGWLL